MSSPRDKLLLAGVICIVFGGFFSIGQLWVFGGTIGLSGIALFVLGMSMKAAEKSMSAEEIADWRPTASLMQEAGRTMYRVDTTLDEPFKTSIVCGACAHLEVIDGKRPSEWCCPNCDLQLWLDEEE